MAEPRGFHPGLRWLVWILYGIAWSLALLTPQPVTLRNEVIHDETLGLIAAKTLHVAAYAVWVILTAWLPAPCRTRWLLLIVISAHAFATEYFQGMVPLRTPSWADIGWDHLGLILGIFVAWRRLRPRC
jgi:hypothetical protein